MYTESLSEDFSVVVVVLLPSLHNQQQRGGTEEDATQERSISFRCCSLFSKGKRHGIGFSKNDDEVV